LQYLARQFSLGLNFPPGAYVAPPFSHAVPAPCCSMGRKCGACCPDCLEDFTCALWEHSGKHATAQRRVRRVDRSQLALHRAACQPRWMPRPRARLRLIGRWLLANDRLYGLSTTHTTTFWLLYWRRTFWSVANDPRLCSLCTVTVRRAPAASKQATCMAVDTRTFTACTLRGTCALA
jgi:hypothetical protein